ncbi:hypothetical protein [Winogradskyella bathintestinalis]|uniref:Uncharacterized protein n=1 Tax=Winogradskyella bathintestinalis TaxID=3035208 RepID=A0ABT7ZVC6_9FLAO|nr:hypothetical protein [Winogradskyella bathintestinalis]MDN3492922.1 hypothetical protein [Winogradskyella bathintestinalis]
MKISKKLHEHVILKSGVSKTIKTIVVLSIMLWFTPTVSIAQDEKESVLMNLTEYTIKFGENSKFTEGVKKWNKCYKENNGTETWNVWHRLQGKGNVYVLSGIMENWAAMDKADPAGKACRTVALDFITPHIESTEFNMARSLPELSRTAALEDNTIVWVTSFKVNNSMVFNEVIKAVSTAINQKEGDKRGYWYSIMGGEGADYFVSSPYKNFADLDTDTDNVWDIYESVHGKSKTKDIREKFRATIDDIWSYLYTLETELSMPHQ